MAKSTYGLGASSVLSIDLVLPCGLTCTKFNKPCSLVNSCSVSARISSSLAREALVLLPAPGFAVVDGPGTCGTNETPDPPAPGVPGLVGLFGVGEAGVMIPLPGRAGAAGVGVPQAKFGVGCAPPPGEEGRSGEAGVGLPGVRGVGSGGKSSLLSTEGRRGGRGRKSSFIDEGRRVVVVDGTSKPPKPLRISKPRALPGGPGLGVVVVVVVVLLVVVVLVNGAKPKPGLPAVPPCGRTPPP